MEYIKLDGNYIEQARILFNDASKTETIYKQLTKNEFESIFYNAKKDVVFIGVGLKNDRGLIAFIFANVMPNAETGYITFAYVVPQNRRSGLGSRLVHMAEQELKAISPSMKKIEITFYNPSNLEWLIPHKKDVFHPNVPGIDVSSGAYIFFKNLGYRDYATQNCYYLNLKEYVLPADTAEKEKKLLDRNIKISIYDKVKHFGFDELFKNLNTADWTEKVMTNINLPNGGNPVLVVDNGGKIAGFTGPIHVQGNGRGYFAGIGVHSDYRGGVGTLLFIYLCKNLKELGASYMTLFTGENNPARNIYEAAGFKIVKCFADMRKEVK